MNRTWRLLTLMAVGVWIVTGIYGVFYNITYVDEAKYLIKGWLMATNQVSYYSTKNFFYQHMPGGLWWYGLGQKLLGPSLLIARIQSFFLGIGVVAASFLTAKKLAGQKAGVVTLGILSLTPVVALYYSSAVPLSISALVLMLGILSLAYQKEYLATFWFSVLFLVRENFLFSLGVYWLWLWWVNNWRIKRVYKHWGLSLGVVGLVAGPGLPGILNVLKNFPRVNTLFVTKAERLVLSNWQQQTHGLNLYLQAIKEFGIIYFPWAVMAFYVLINKGKIKLAKNKQAVWCLLTTLFWLNLLIHAVAVFQLSPRAIVSYFAYVAPMGAVIISGYLSQLRFRQLIVGWLLLLLTLPVSVRVSSIFTRENTINKLRVSRNNLSSLIAGKDKIIWLAEPMSLYLAGKLSYYPLINHTNFFKPVNNTETVRDLGFWNQKMMGQWLNEAELLVIDPNRLKLMRQVETTSPFVVWFEERVNETWQEKQIEEYIWPEGLQFYTRSLRTR